VSGMSARRALPLIDQHERLVACDRFRAWRALGAHLAREPDAMTRVAVFLLRCEPSHPSGTPLVAGSTVSGFVVVRSQERASLVLEGKHRFSRYELTFELEAEDAATVIRATTRALFPGLAGAAYRSLVIGSGAHRLAVRMLLSRVASRATSGVNSLPRQHSQARDR
jgi:hypothetical protein